ncbi:MAG TPA: flavodoxin [Porphyromonadaceae bacterium]|jgi:flavodoxin I|uniref:flavodoxin n=1 Tax=Limibacterium fermenti TaxID=3229863 RepID=UPI000E8CF381|nr:flavodoxin [Porphyromonadaceae bacterium]HBL34918.1 flavodoxin [Porphyromonadaceae bacterium]HBX46243.1 flavodoxin [Porphyromonadaceae bacterium]
MSKIAILYGSSGGNTEQVAEKIKNLFDGNADLFNVDSVKLDEIKAYPYLILGTSTTGVGDLQDDWDSFLPTFSKADLSDKTVAIFGLGDSASFSDTFAQSMKVIYDAIHDKTRLIGQVPDEGYTYDASEAVIDDTWVGLPIDEDNEYDQTDSRVEAWVAELKKTFV